MEYLPFTAPLPVPAAFVSPETLTVEPDSATLVKVNVVFLVMFSVLEALVSLAATRSTVGTTGASLSTV